MGAAETKAGNAKYIKQPIRKALKKMAYVSQIAKCVTLIPSPEEFTTQVIGEVITMMGKIRNLTDRINTIVESYSTFPMDYLTDATNNVMGALSSVAAGVGNATQSMVDTLHGVAEDVDFLATNSVGILTDLVAESNTATHYLGNTTNATHEGLSNMSNAIDGVMGKVDNANNKVNEKLKDAIDKIAEAMNKVTDTLNSAFGDFMLDSITLGASVESLDQAATDFNNGTAAGALISSTSDTISNIAKSFDIGKIAKGCVGMATNLGLVAAGIDQLPQLNMERVLAFGRAKMDELSEKTLMATKEFKESEEYKRMVDEAEGDKKKIREKLREKRKLSAQERRISMEKVSPEERIAKRSVAKDVRKAKMQAKKAKVAQKLKETLIIEINRFKDDIKQFGTNINDDWMTMQNQYNTAVMEIKKFFTGDPNEATGSKYIDDCCDAIETDCDSIKETLKNLTTTITVTVAQIPAPTSVGQCFDFPLYKVLRWFECLKVILNEIMKVINYGIDIIRQVNNLVKIILNGINSLKEIKEKIMEILNVKWLLDFIDTIIELFSGKCLEGKELMENSISPILFNETEQYEGMMNSLETELSEMQNEDDEDETKKMEERIDALEEMGESIYAYKSPLLNDEGTDFKGWIFYYANIDNRYRNNQKLKKKFSRLIMKRAAKTGNRKKGGKNMLLRKEVFKLHQGMTINGVYTQKPKAFDAFYWYTKWTTDPNDDTIERTYDELDNNTDVVSPVMTTENGTLVELEDGRRVFVNDFGVKSGDYILVEGQRYRVK